VKGFLAIVRREILERRRLLAAAAVAGLVPLAVPPLCHVGAANAADVRSSTAFVLSIAFALGTSVGLGATMIVPALVSRRLAFDFARPLSGAAIWGGRLGASLALASMAAVLVWIPTLLTGSRIPLSDIVPTVRFSRAWPLMALACLAVLFAASHGAKLVARSRSPLIVADVALATLATLGFSNALSRVPLHDARTLSNAMMGMSIAIGLAFLAGAQASVVWGRVDARAAHRSFAIVFWTVIGAAIVIAQAYSLWGAGRIL
jgi:hypothetical protein